jgi:hypothetical protein
MKVFRIRLDSNQFQSFLPRDERIWKTETLTMNCSRKLQGWVPPDVYVWNPKLKLGDFFHFCSGAFVVDSKSMNGLRDLLEMAGELLPLSYKESTYYLMNILECANCLDRQKTQWVFDKKTGMPVRIVKYEFHRSRFPESTLFKIPETAPGEMLTVTGLKDAEDEFKPRVEQLGLRGLLFEELWSG